MGRKKRETILAKHLRKVSNLVRDEGCAASLANSRRKIKLTGFIGELQKLIDDIPHLAGEAASRGRWGFVKRFNGCGQIAIQQKLTNQIDGQVIEPLKPLVNYCLKHQLGIFLRNEKVNDSDDLVITIAWEKPLPDGWAFRAKPEEWLLIYKTN